jgi:hypothetical protein
MSLPAATGGYALGPNEGEALWFNGGLGILKATTELTDGRFAAIELRVPKGFASPLQGRATPPDLRAVWRRRVLPRGWQAGWCIRAPARR